MQLTCVFAACAAPVLLDATRIVQVMQNLLSNALAHTPAGGRIHAGGRRQGESYAVRIQDTGSGIPEAELPHVFERLYRADAARAGGGSGLGLSISRSIIEAHGGEISLSSPPGEGTAVTFSLPLVGAPT